MTRTWHSDCPPPPTRKLCVLDWLRVLRRGAVVGPTLAMGLACLGLARLTEGSVGQGAARPLSGVVVMGVCRVCLWALGLEQQIHGRPMGKPGLVVSNHASWLDILVLNAAQRVVFVAKSEVADWPGIGVLARVTGTLFVRRDRTDLPRQAREVAARIAAGQRLLVFPEGTSTDGRRVLQFNPSLFQRVFSGNAAAAVQPVTVAYRAPEGADTRYYGWWGDMDLVPHLLTIMATPRQGHVAVVLHPPVSIQERMDRKTLARTCETTIRDALAVRLNPEDRT